MIVIDGIIDDVLTDIDGIEDNIIICIGKIIEQ